LGFNLIWTFANVPVHVVLGVLIAVLLNQPGLWFKRAYRAIYVLPMVIPTLVVAAVWKNMYDPSNGAINQLLKSTFEPLITFGQANLGLFADINLKTFFQIRWFAQIDPPFGLLPGLPLPLSFYAMLIANIWLGWPFMTIVATGALQSVPGDLYEAAALDGASGSQQFFQITVPLIRPAMVPAAMLGIITTFNLFNFVYLMSGGGPLRQTEIMVTTAYSLVKANQLYGMAAGFCVIIFFVLLGLTLLTNAITKGTERYDI
jgi:arabinogalactan oligomer/maltooligosaccharide transport system permease protein